MAQDLKFDVDTMEIAIKNGDFVLTSNSAELSEQNGGLILYTKNMNLLNPTIGVGIGGVLNSDQATIQSYLNRWKSQTLQDGSKSSTWNINIGDNGYEIETSCSYE